MNKLRVAAVAALALAAPAITWAAGSFMTLPVVGGSAFCGSTVSGVVTPSSQGPYAVVPGSTQGTGQGICGQTVPAGPSGLTGEELIPADTGATASSSPQTVTIPSALLGGAGGGNNKIIGGDFATNLWQRTTTPLTTTSPSPAVLTADRFFVFSTSNDVSVSKQTGASDQVSASGLYASMRVARPSQTTLNPISVGQVMDQAWSQSFIGNNMVCSFWAQAGAGFSAANSLLTVTPAYYTAADSATPNTNTQTFANGTITGYQAAGGGTSPNFPAGSVAAGVVSVPITTSWQRYAVWASIPQFNASNVAVNGVGLSIGYTPTGTGSSTDWFELEGVQCQPMPSTVTANLPNGVISPTAFERIAPVTDAQRQLWYSYVLLDSPTTKHYGLGQVSNSTTIAEMYVQFPEEMREIPTTTVSTSASFGFTASTGVAGACSALVANPIGGNSTVGGSLQCTGTSFSAGGATQFMSAGTGGAVTFSAEP